jgi:four helix bundle protein
VATIRQFEELLCWQKARDLTREIYKIFKDLKFKGLKFQDYGFQDQIQRAAVSIMSNIAEGFERGTRQEFLNYLFIAKGSCGEVRAQLYVALDAGYIDTAAFKSLKFKVEECSRLISNFIQSLKVSEFQGLQYKRGKTQAQKEREEFDARIREMAEEAAKERRKKGML